MRSSAARSRCSTNVDLFGEGFDVPAIEAAFLLRPTRSLALYLQQVGRSLRPAPGKTEALIFDHAGNCRMHGLPDDERVWTLEGREKEKKKSDAPPIKQCPMCFSWLSAATELCRHCGHKFVVQAREIEQIDGELQEVSPSEMRARARAAEEQYFAKADTVDELARIGQAARLQRPGEVGALSV
jgi:DNA repair protein RadD